MTISWKCIDPMLCTYEAEIEGKVYHGQRTVNDTVKVFYLGAELSTHRDLATALEAAKGHANDPQT